VCTNDWYRASLNFALEDFDDDYVREATSATCPRCRTTIPIGALVVEADGTWTVPESS
jgi:hypothetical protein